jgi:hypothetical protein
MSGNGLLDVILFMPIGLFFLFAVTDGGLHLVERAAIQDAIRAGLHTEYDTEREFSVVRYSESNEIELDRDEARALAQHFVEEIRNNFSFVTYRAHDEAAPTRSVGVSVFAVDVDPRVGRLYGNAVELLAEEYSTADGFPASSMVSGYPYISRSDYVAAQLAAEADSEASQFAQPGGNVFFDDGQLNVSHRYLSKAILVYVEVRAVTSGTNQAFVKNALGSLYAVQYQQLQSVRSTLRSNR